MSCRTYAAVKWIVEIGDEFEPEYDALPDDVQNELLAMTRLLQQFWPQLKRPHADTMNGSRHANMKELRFKAARWHLARSVRVRSEAQGHPSGDRRQIRCQRKEVLP